jgi:hypothetical protein
MKIILSIPAARYNISGKVALCMHRGKSNKNHRRRWKRGYVLKMQPPLYVNKFPAITNVQEFVTNGESQSYRSYSILFLFRRHV